MYIIVDTVKEAFMGCQTCFASVLAYLERSNKPLLDRLMKSFLPLVSLHSISDLAEISPDTIFFIRKTSNGFQRVTFPDKKTADFCLYMFEESALSGEIIVSENYDDTHQRFLNLLKNSPGNRIEIKNCKF